MNSTEGSMKELIETINKLQDVFAILGGQQSTGITLPQIAVVGTQSAGKSSVLETLVGKDFLPRGQGIVTRRPLILQMIQRPGEEYGEFLHSPNKKYTNFGEVKEEIEIETRKVAGSNKGLSKDPIRLKVYSPEVLDLTIIDLPGVTKIPIGDQPTNIQQQVEEMIEDYIKEENTLILAITAANGDLTNSDGLNLARRFDPEGTRTIGVLTKLDLMDDGTNALDIFEGKTLKLSLGYIGVVNRSQHAINSNKTIDEAIRDEAEWFKSDPKAGPYRQIRSRMGSQYLQKVLNEQLGKHIKDKLPGIRRCLQKKVQELKRTLQDLGHSDEDNEHQTQSSLVYTLLNKFNSRLQSQVEGRSLDVPLNHVGPGAAINRTIYGEVDEFIHQALRGPNGDEIMMALVNLSGYRNNLYPNQDAIDIAIRQLVENYRAPLYSSLEAIKTIFIHAIEDAARLYIGTYPTLLNRVLCLVNDNVLKNETETINHLMSFVNAHQAFINTKHPSFLKSLKTRQETNASFGHVNLAIMHSEDANAPRGFRHSPSVPMVRQEGKLTLLPNEEEVDVVIHGKRLTYRPIEDDDRSIDDDKEEVPAVSFDLNDCKCNSYNESGDQKRFVIQKRNQEPLFGNVDKVEFLATQSSELNAWTKAFIDLGILQRNNTNPAGTVTGPPLRNYEKEVKSDQSLKENMELVRQMVEDYMKVIHDSIQDMTPKFIIMSLLQATMKYTQESLTGDLLPPGTTLEEFVALTETSAEDKRKVEQIFATKKATEDALIIVNNISDKALKVEQQ